MITPMDCGTGQKLYQKAKRLMPGGTQLLSKRPEMFLPGFWPAYYDHAQGAELWDLDGNHFVDMSYCGIGATVLGYADTDVNSAVRDAVDKGTMTTLNCPEEVELAEIMLDLHPWADMIRFGRCGGEALAIAVRIARAHTKRQRVAFCGYHGWHDWYLAANLREEGALNDHLLPGLDPNGVPRGLLATALPFRYNKLEELRAWVEKYPGEIGVIVMEPLRGNQPAPGFLEGVRDIATEIGAVLMFDEVTSGFRVCTGGVHLTMPVIPDMAVFAKALGNGFPIAAVMGRGDIMQAAQTSFISSTYWTERIGPTAALAVIRKFKEHNVPDHLVSIGQEVKRAWEHAAIKAGLNIHVSGMDPLAHFGMEHPDAQALKTLFTQLMLERGFLATTSFYAMFAHTPEHVTSYGLAVHEAFSVMAQAVQDNNVMSLLRGPVCHSGFARLT